MTDQEQKKQMTAQTFGLALLAVALVVVVILTFALFGGEDVGMSIVVAAMAVVGAFLVWRYDTLWALITGLVLTLALAFFSFFFAFGVLQPFSPLEFIIGAAYVVGFLFALIGGIAGLFRRNAEPRKKLQTGALGLIGVAAVVSVVGFFFTRSTVSEAEAAGATVLDMVDFVFAPESTTVASGERLLLTNSDAFAHDLTLDEHDVYVYLGPGGESLVDLSGVPAGTYQYYCSLHTFEENGVKEGMVGEITIES